jgi:polysaccharide biosynthesis transport protein
MDTSSMIDFKALESSPAAPSGPDGGGEATSRSSLAAAYPPGMAPLPNLGSLFQSLRNTWPLALGIALVSAVLTAVFLDRLLPSTYLTTVWLRLQGPVPAAVADEPGENPRPSVPFVPPHLFKNPPLLTRVLDLPQIADLAEVRRQWQARLWLEENLQVEADSTGLVRLMLTTRRPETGTVLLEKIIEAYQEQWRDQRQTLRAQLREQYQRLASQLPPPAKATPAGALNPGGNPSEAALTQNRLELRKVQAELTVALRQAQSVAAGTIAAGQVQEQLNQDSTVNKALLECHRLEKLLVQIKNTAVRKEQDPYYLEKAGELEAVRQRIRQRELEIAGKLERQLQAKVREERQARIAQLRQRLETLQELDRKLSAETGQRQAELPREGPLSPRPLEAQDPGKEEALRRLGAEIQLLEAAGPDDVGVEPCSDIETIATQRGRRTATVALSTATVFGFILLVFAWVEFQDRRVRTPASVAQGLRLAVVGALPAGPLPATLPPGPTTDLHALAHQNHMAEAADVLRTMVLKQLDGKPGVVLVATSRGAEGATTVACQLALSLARGWRRTLLIDGHVRQPAVHTLFQVGVEPGLCEVLRGEIDAADAVQPAKISRLWLLPSGNWDQHALQALAQENTTMLLESFKDQYDVVVIDAGPLLPLADGLLLAQQADLVVLSALCGVSRLPVLDEAGQRLTTLGVPLLGVVVSGTAAT